MEGKDLINQANEAFEQSTRQLRRLEEEIQRQNAELAGIKEELIQLGLDPNRLDTIPESILSLPFPKELSDTVYAFKRIMTELENLEEHQSKERKKVSNPMNKLKML